MTFIEKLRKGEFAITGEFEPPKAVDKSFLEQAKHFKGYVDAINATDAPLGKPQMCSLVPSYIVKQELGIEPIIQMCARDRNRIAIMGDLLGAKLLGIDNVLCITGDYAVTKCKQPYDLDSVRFVRLVKEEMPKQFPGFEMTAGVALNPMATPQEPELIKLEKKMIWADFVQTQPIYDLSLLEADTIQRFKDKILVGVMPLISKGFAEYFNEKVPGFKIPEDVVNSIKTEEDGVELAKQQCQEIKKLGFAGVHLMVFKVESRIPEILKPII